MSLYQSTYRLKIYRNFKAIESNAFHTVIRYFEDYEDDIRDLELEEYFEILVSYVQALHETGSFARHLLYVDDVIEMSIMHNIKYFGGLDIYEHMLFKKAASYFHLMHFEKAETIIKQLIRINPDEVQNIQFLKKCERKRAEKASNAFRLAALFFFFSSAALIACELFITRPGFIFIAEQVEIYRTIAFGMGLATMALHEIYVRFYASFKARQYVSGTVARKKNHRLTIH